MTVLIIIAGLLIAAFLGWPLTVLVLKLTRSVDNEIEGPAAASPTESVDSSQVEVPAESLQVQESAAALIADQESDKAAVQKPASPAALNSALALDTAPNKVLRGGLLIGILERLAVVLCLVFDQPVAIAYVIAVKGLGRYPELKESPAASERFIIGTLSSLIFATVVGILARWLIGMNWR